MSEEQLVGTLMKDPEKPWDVKFIPNAEPQPQLTISESIADMLDFIYDNHFDSKYDVSWVITNMDFVPTDDDYYTLDAWLDYNIDNHNLALAYHSGKSLGVGLVKVVADENI